MKQELLHECSRMFRISPEDIMSRRRAKPILMARYAMYAGLRRRGWSFPAIGRFMQRDHSSVQVGTRKAQQYIEQHAEYAAKVSALAAWKPAHMNPKEPT